MTPMMEQYFEIKNQYQDYLLFYRLGDFYEMFFDDAVVASRELDLTLTGRDCGEAERAPMCGVPFHSADDYIGRLIAKGYKVAICEQVEDPAQAKGLVRREVIREVTPGTLIEDSLLPAQRNNYLCSLYLGESGCGVCFADISTAQVFATSFPGAEAAVRVRNEIGTWAPRELLCNLARGQMGEVGEVLSSHPEIMLTDGQSARYAPAAAGALVREQFGESLRPETLEDVPLVCAVGAALSYIRDTEKRDVSYIRELNVYADGQYLELDVNTRRNLELTESMRTKEKKGSLLWVLDKTRTSPGARMLRQWVEHPLRSARDIDRRQDAVEGLYGSFMLREELGELLSHVLDLERLLTRIVYGTANARRFLERMKAEGREYHFVEVMACPGGCIGGGGQPKDLMKDADETRKCRIAALYRRDEAMTLRTSHENPEIKEVYAAFYGQPLSEMAEKMLHTSYRDQSGLLHKQAGPDNDKTTKGEVKTMSKWKCKVCGYIYEGDTLPEGFTCPLCKQPASSFEKIEEAPAKGANKYAGTQTEKNLQAAFAGESQARNKYTYFSSVAQNEGFEQIAALFQLTAQNEMAHAKLWFEELNGLGDTAQNLLHAAEGENYEWTEKRHEERYRALLYNVETAQVFEKSEVKVWECRNCGHIVVGTAAPEVCPTCNYSKSFFEIHSDNF